MRFSNAGHPKPLHVKRAVDQVLALANSTGRPQPALGLFDDAAYTTTATQLHPSDMILLFTDGLIEVHNRAEELLTEAQLLDILKKFLRAPKQQLLDRVLAEIQAFADGSRFTDDVCLVGMDFTGYTTPLHPET
jgi:sigma-B regulation protein RsbU (phosphoserine phosphatase)